MSTTGPGVEGAAARQEAAAAHGRYLDVGGVRTFYIQVGGGHPVLLIHGASPGSCSNVAWKRNINPLARTGLAVYAVDQPGFGYSDDPPDDDSLEYRVTHVRAFIDTLDLGRYHLVGNSVGAYIAARLALEDPRAVRLVLVASSTLAPRGSAEADALARRHAEELRTFTPGVQQMRNLTMKTLFHRDLVTDAFVHERLAMASGRRFEAHVRRQRAPRARPILDELPNLKTKTLIVWGRNDQGAAVERALLLFQVIPGAELHLFDRCGHWVQWDQAERFNRLVADFLSGDS